jgi:hypothetical protein
MYSYHVPITLTQKVLHQRSIFRILLSAIYANEVQLHTYSIIPKHRNTAFWYPKCFPVSLVLTRDRCIVVREDALIQNSFWVLKCTHTHTHTHTSHFIRQGTLVYRKL